MELWLDTIDFHLIEKTTRQLNLIGVTTNPSILAKSSLSAKDTISKLLEIQAGMVAVQVTEERADGMINQAMEIASYSSRIIIKVPVNHEGLIAIKALADRNIPTMATAIFEVSQVLLSAMAGSTYAAPYFGRIPTDNYAILQDMLDIIKIYKYPLKIIAAAIKNKEQIVNVAKLGTHAVTIPVEPFKEFIGDLSSTTESLIQFAKNWSESGKSLNII